MPRAAGRSRACLLALAAALLPGLAAAAELHAWEAGDSPAALRGWVEARLARASAAITELRAEQAPRSIENTLARYDEAYALIVEAQAQAQLMNGVSTQRELRDAGQALAQSASAALTALSLDREVYQALASIPQPADPATRHYLERALLEYRLAGVDRNAATRERIRTLQAQITERSLAFERAVHEDVRSVQVSAQELTGLPEDYLRAHPPDASGKVRLTSDPPDAYPPMKFADSAGVRRELYLASHAVGYPQNTATLKALLGARAELARLLGFASWPDYALRDQMLDTTAKVAGLIAEVDAATRTQAAREGEELLAFARTREAGLRRIDAADLRYWQEQYRRARFGFDSQSVRPYFPYAQVERGVIATAARVLHVEIRPAPQLRAWHSAVSTYEVFDHGRKLGALYLDMHPREGKDKWFSTWLVTAGRAGTLPDGALVCNFPGGAAGEPGLMDYMDVITFLHEFGHLMHHVIGGQQRFAGEGALGAGQGSLGIEGDFIEVPSQMLEEFFRDYQVVRGFARHYQTHASLPHGLFARMARAQAYGRAGDQQRQLMFTQLSLLMHTQGNGAESFDALYRRTFERYNTSAFVPGDHYWASFTHLTGYGSNYYAYVFDRVIALDFFARFDPRDPLGGDTGLRYRTLVLAPGSTRPAAQLVRDFLGRDANPEAYRRWLAAGTQPP